MKLDQQEKHKIIKILVIFVFFLNILDAGTTMFAISSKIAIEHNPIMAFFYNISPWVFLFAKLFIASFFALFLLMDEKDNLSWIGSILVSVCYTALIVYQSVYIYLTLRPPMS